MPAQALIDAIVAKPDTSIWELVFMSPEELHLVHKFTVVPGVALPDGREAEALRPCIFDKHGQMLPPGIPGQLVLLPYDVAAQEADYGESKCSLLCFNGLHRNQGCRGRGRCRALRLCMQENLAAVGIAFETGGQSAQDDILQGQVKGRRQFWFSKPLMSCTIASVCCLINE